MQKGDQPLNLASSEDDTRIDMTPVLQQKRESEKGHFTYDQMTVRSPDDQQAAVKPKVIQKLARLDKRTAETYDQMYGQRQVILPMSGKLMKKNEIRSSRRIEQND